MESASVSLTARATSIVYQYKYHIVVGNTEYPLFTASLQYKLSRML